MAGSLEAAVGEAPPRVDVRDRERSGRATVRAALYMATLVATRRDPVIKAYYQHLKGRGKPKKVALVACMRADVDKPLYCG